MPVTLISSFQAHPSFRQLAAACARPAVKLSGLSSSAAALVLTLLRRQTGRRLVWICENNRVAEVLRHELELFHRLLGVEARIFALPASEADPYRGLSTHPEIAEQRVVALWAALEKRCDILLVPLRSWMQKLQRREALQQRWIRLEAGTQMPLQDLLERLGEAGYVDEDPVGRVGEFARRGGIVDVFPPQESCPVRLEFFGDSLESLRTYDPATQRSVGYAASVTLLPMREETPSPDELRRWSEAALRRWGSVQYSRALDERLLVAEHGQAFEGMEFLLPLEQERAASICEYMADATLVLPEPDLVRQELQRLWGQLEQQFQTRQAACDLALPPDQLFFAEPPGDFPHRVEITELDLDPSGAIHFSAPPVRSFGGAMRDLVEHVARGLEHQHRFVFAVDTRGTGERLRDIFRDYGLAARVGDRIEDPPAPLLISIGRLHQSFTLPDVQVSFYRQQDVFAEEKKPQHRPPRRDQRGVFLSDLRDLKEGDYVVHVDHGIGVFRGLKRIGVGDGSKEFVLLTYRDSARLYVPVERLDLIQKYSGAGGARPPLDKLGGITWEKTKTRVRKAMRDMAEELLRLYALREAAAGYAFSEDDALQQEFDSAFEFEETPDQETAIREVKRDMQSPRPMDRLVCGDVGYGKTEVAMRGAFKAVLDRKQVAVLTPTTVLAFQHFQTFRERFKAFPVTIEMISRFRTRSEQREILKRTEEGKIDILIGTHRILSRDVRFSDLGLVVVDEEQRFGVTQKEWLKKLKTRVDVITLSATPIPRTLHMSLLGLRDLSIIETPPQDRIAIQTAVVKFDKEIIRSAIDLEMQREGQAFFVHNRVESIYSMANLIQRICAAARVGVAHGQMSERELEDVMLRFVSYQYDVLVCTTIIENGLDIPRANTMLIHRADRYGLSQLYQLRGRVGRSNRRAYAYMLVPPGDLLSAVARKRLAAIREFSELGAGFRLAALDLEIRGAGNLLGGEQHGQINAVGFEMYTNLLERTIRELKGEQVEEEFRASIDLQWDIRIPDHYVEETNQRLRLYKRISAARDEAELEKVREEVADRFGRLPQSVENLFHYARLRQRAEALHVVSIDRRGEAVLIKFADDAKIQAARVIERVERDPRLSVTPAGVLRFHLSDQDLALTSRRILDLLEEIRR